MTTTSFPLYDGHGNVKASLVRVGVDGFATSGWKAYDVWGGLLDGNGFLGEHGYCGNLGHISDPSGAIYMRARYYEPWTGRFLSEDPAMDGTNWYAYCSNNPVGRADPTGCADSPLDNIPDKYAKLPLDLLGIFKGVSGMLEGMSKSAVSRQIGLIHVRFLIVYFDAIRDVHSAAQSSLAERIVSTTLFALMTVIIAAGAITPTTPTTEIVGMMEEHVGFLLLFIALEDFFMNFIDK